jgi:hypothetical protein
MAKVSYAAAAAMLAGSLAFGFPSKGDAPAPAQIVAPVDLRAEILAARRSKSATLPVPPRLTEKPRRPHVVPAEQRSIEKKPVEQVPEAPARMARPSNGNLVSPVTQLRLLYVMQQEVNARVAEVYRAAPNDGRGGRLFTTAQREVLRRAAEDQAQLARLAALLAEEFERQ